MLRTASQIVANFLEKQATQSWKKHFHELSKKSKQRLLDAGIHDYKKEMIGLAKGNQALGKKLNIRTVRTIPPPDVAGGANLRSYVRSSEHPALAYGGSPLPWITAVDEAFHPKPGEAPASSTVYAPKLKYKKMQKLKASWPKGTEAASSLSAKGGVEGLQDAMGRLNKFNRDYFGVIVKDHETSEGRSMLNHFSHRTALPSSFHGHQDPWVLARESANVALAPPEVQKVFKRMRRFQKDVPVADILGNGVVPQKKMTEVASLRELSKRRGDSTTPVFEYGKRAVNDKRTLRNIRKNYQQIAADERFNESNYLVTGGQRRAGGLNNLHSRPSQGELMKRLSPKKQKNINMGIQEQLADERAAKKGLTAAHKFSKESPGSHYTTDPLGLPRDEMRKDEMQTWRLTEEALRDLAKPK